MRGRKPTPTVLKVITGNPGGRKLNDKEPQPEVDFVCPDPPDYLDEIAKKEWSRVAPLLHEIGLLTQVDVTALSAYCSAYSRWLEAEKNIKKLGVIIKAPKSGYPVQTPYLSIANKAIEQMKNFLVEFGMTPSSRSRIGVGIGKDGKPGNEWDDI